MTEPVFDQLAIALQEIRTRLGDGILDDKRRLNGLLFDAAPDAKREIRVIRTAIDEGVPDALRHAERELLGLEMDRQANRLESSTGMRQDLALQIVRLLAFALDQGPLPSVYQQTHVAPARPPPAAAWSGASQSPATTAPPASAPAANPLSPVLARLPGLLAGLSGLLAKLPFDRKYLFAGLGVVVVLFLAFQLFSPHPAPPAPPAGPAQAPATDNGPAGQNFAGELTDTGVAAKSTLETNVGSPTPLSIPVGQRITTTQVQALLVRDTSTVLIDVLADAHDNTLRGAVHIPLAGYPGTVTDPTQAQVAAQLKTAIGDRPQRPVVFFCMGAGCWESYNAVLRASAAGYSNIYWYRGGLASWREAGLPMQPLSPTS